MYNGIIIIVPTVWNDHYAHQILQNGRIKCPFFRKAVCLHCPHCSARQEREKKRNLSLHVSFFFSEGIQKARHFVTHTHTHTHTHTPDVFFFVIDEQRAVLHHQIPRNYDVVGLTFHKLLASNDNRRMVHQTICSCIQRVHFILFALSILCWKTKQIAHILPTTNLFHTSCLQWHDIRVDCELVYTEVLIIS